MKLNLIFFPHSGTIRNKYGKPHNICNSTKNKHVRFENTNHIYYGITLLGGNTYIVFIWNSNNNNNNNNITLWYQLITTLLNLYWSILKFTSTKNVQKHTIDPDPIFNITTILIPPAKRILLHFFYSCHDKYGGN